MAQRALKASQRLADGASVRLYTLLREGDDKCLCSPLEKDRHMQYYQKGGNVRGESGLEVHEVSYRRVLMCVCLHLHTQRSIICR